MKYLMLSKIFYIDNDNYNKIYQQRYHNEFTLHYDFKIGTYNAFVVMTPEILNLVTDILGNDKELQFISHSIPKVALQQYIKRCIIDEVKQTNDIEGVYSTRQEIAEVMKASTESGKHKRLYGITQKYSLLAKQLGENTSKPETCEDIRNLYDELVLKDVCEEDFKNHPDGKIFRKHGVEIVSSDKAIHYGIEPESNIISYMDKALKILNDPDQNFLISISVFHYMFGYIHPFYDGNGRTARFISSLLLLEHLESLVSLNLSYTIKNRQRDYYKAFKYSNDPKNLGDMTPFVIIFLQILLETIQSQKKSLENKREKLDFYEKKQNELISQDKEHWDKNMMNIFYILIQNSLFGENGLTVEDLAKNGEISSSTVRKVLKEIPKEYLYITYEGRKNLYDVNLNNLGDTKPDSHDK